MASSNSTVGEMALTPPRSCTRSLAALLIGTTLFTLWIMIQGFRILTGRSRDSMMAMVTDMGRIGVIVAAATTMAVGSVDLQQFFGSDMAKGINQLVTGSDDSPAESIDKNLLYTQLAMAAIEAVPVPPADVAAGISQAKSSLIATLGVAGPPMTAGAILLMYQVALALFIGLGPLFILCLIFDYTKPMFQRWLMYGFSTLFSLAVLNFVTSLVLQLTIKVAGGLWAVKIISGLTGLDTEGFNNQAMQQGGVGLLMTVLLISTPPMAAAFFGGTLGQFASYAQVNGGVNPNSVGLQGQPPGAAVFNGSSPNPNGGLSGNSRSTTELNRLNDPSLLKKMPTADVIKPPEPHSI